MKLSSTIIAFSVAFASASFAEEVTITEPDGTSWGSYTTTLECVESAVRRQLEADAIVSVTPSNVSGFHIDDQTGRLKEFIVNLREYSPDQPDIVVVESILHNFAEASKDEVGGFVAHTQKNGLLSYVPQSYRTGDIEDPDSIWQVMLSNGGSAIQTQGRTSYDTFQVLKDVDEEVQACLKLG